ncbi:MAG TPA: hypothetical protein VNQ57_02430 [Ureibacillus sp.]|nr:hypothetical protein [Ureibacillus sp.]
MDEKRIKEYDYTNSNKNKNEVVKMATMSLTKTVRRDTSKAEKVKNPKKKSSAIEVSNSIGVHGAFGHTLSDLHKQGR